MISQKQRIRQDKLEKRYRRLGAHHIQAHVLARCVIERRGGFGLFRASGVPVKGKRKGVEAKVKRQKDEMWSVRKDIEV